MSLVVSFPEDMIHLSDHRKDVALHLTYDKGHPYGNSSEDSPRIFILSLLFFFRGGRSWNSGEYHFF